MVDIMETELTTPTSYPSNNQAKSSPPSRKARFIGAGLVLIVLCFIAGIGGSYLYDAYIARPTTSLSSSYDGNSIVSKEEEDVAAVADKVAPSVVSILTTSQSQSIYSQEQAGAGTGVIISKDGYILTNNHVIDGATQVNVVNADGTTYENVKIIGRDPLNDVAFLKISNVSDLPAAQLGDSKSVRIGQKVIAIGNALGQYQNTVTSGIISGTGRSVEASLDGTDTGDTESLTDLIQTDAAINSGNSGGPLVNLAGQVIGINTAIASDANSVGFVIPISSTKGVIESVIQSGKVSRAYLGVRYLAVTPDVAKKYDLSVKQGAYIFAEGNGSAVVPGGPASKAGIKEKDIITKVNGVEIGTKGSVATLIGEYKPGDTVELTVLRDGKTLTVKVNLTPYSS
ncbi:MAG: putative HtrA2 peptidase [Candidatus Saccharibacteria bacterium]|nr:putative HtrA2 peptidase [Candidatus Saccharibacteria bacterium]